MMGMTANYIRAREASAQTARLREYYQHLFQQLIVRRNDTMVAHYLLIECKEAGE